MKLLAGLIEFLAFMSVLRANVAGRGGGFRLGHMLAANVGEYLPSLPWRR